MASDDLRQIAEGIHAGEINASLTMQLATANNEQPWNCTVYFVYLAGCFYWLSFPERRHSQELTTNSSAAIAIVLQPTQPVLGIQAEGTVEVIEDADKAQAVLELYIKKYNQGSQFIANLKKGSNKHNLYKFTPRRIVAFDERGGSAVTSPREIEIT